MLLSSAIGQEIRSYCIFDSDFHTARQVAAREREANEKGVNLHIWKRKELENYLLVPAAILRTLAPKPRDDQPMLTSELISQKLFEFAGELREHVMDAYASEFLAENRAGGPSQANRSARQVMAPTWDTVHGRLSLVSGKEMLSRLSGWTQESYGVAISPARIAREMRRAEIAEEVVEVLNSIENNLPF